MQENTHIQKTYTHIYFINFRNFYAYIKPAQAHLEFGTTRSRLRTASKEIEIPLEAVKVFDYIVS